MDSERWRRVEQLYHSALEQAPEQRRAFLSGVCAGDGDLLRLLEDLVSQDSATNELVAQPIWEVLASSTGPLDPLAVGTKLGPYKIVGALGEGGMGKVYRALDTRLDRAVAIKVSAEQFSARFEREAQAISALNHPNIFTLYDVGPNYLVMELVEGETLAERIQRVGALPDRQVLEMGIQIARALEAAHSKDIVHRDLKPANVKITPEGQAKVLDFGLAKMVRDLPAAGSVPNSLTAAMTGSVAGQLLGTPAYMSPEQARGESVDSRTDIFAFGCMLFEMIAGQRAFLAQSNSETIAAIVEREPNWPALPVKTPKRIRRLLRTCLERDTERRPANMKVIRACLEEERRRRVSKVWRLRISVAAALGALVSTAFLVWAFRSDATYPNDELLRPIPLTSYPGTQSGPTFSPDGNQVAFSWDGEKQDNFDIYIKRIGPEPPRRLTYDPADELSPAWSPDGNWIAFLRASAPGRNTVVLIPSAGGSERVLAEVAAAPSFRKGLAWSPDGKSLALFDRPPGQAPGIWLLSVGNGTRRRLTTIFERRGEPSDNAFEFDPRGRQLAFIREISANDADLYLQQLANDLTPIGKLQRLTRDNQDTNGLAWTADGRELVFSSGPPSDEALWRMSIARGAHSRRLTAQDAAYGIAISTRAHRLVFEQTRRELDIYRLELDKRGRGVGTSIPLIVSSRPDRGPKYSPNGKEIAFTSLRSGSWQLWISDSNGANPRQVTSFERGEVVMPVWSPDGREIGFISTAEGPSYKYVVHAGGGIPRKIEGLGTDARPWTWSPDGRWILFSSSQSGNLQIWRMPAGGGPAEQVTRQGFGFARMFTPSADGKLLYYSGPDGVWSVPIQGGEEREVFRFKRGLELRSAPGLGATGLGIYFVGGGTTRKPGQLMFYRFSDKSINKVAGAESPSSYGLSLSPDGRYLLYSKFTGSGSDLMLVENFQ